MTLAGKNPPLPPDEFEMSTDGSRKIVSIRDRPVTLEDARIWIRSTGDDPDDFDISIRHIAYGQDMVSNRMSATPKKGRETVDNDIDLPSLYSASRKKVVAKMGGDVSKTAVVVASDIQLGKVSHRGGTQELLERLVEKRSVLQKHLKSERPSSLVFMDGGDLFENFESGGNPMFTNDLSLAQQLDLAATEIYEFVRLMSKFGHVDVMATTSNHTAWRSGSKRLGRPGDDLAFHVHRQVEKLCKEVGIDATWHFPATDYDETLCIDVRGTGLGLVHGDQAGSADRFPAWFAKQTVGGSPLARAACVVSGHFHFLRVQPVGRTVEGKQKWWIQAPTLDNGSDWWMNAGGGYDSDPGLVTFNITDDGFDLNSLRVL